ncbi:hypothetical protein HN014_22295 (plasmid) [Aquimarina sp. TRL1]|uniref:hypothetical protein n=1 Tax=Aquimarina sp. (strain TRL1) TaxID=2736252 RepID=UPI00158BE473|nr:hypothetical protein [Aquimarina sp. TRL1]QKX07733.1 hypothetical protein HN014_22295 [Aquimarina sp. TRL1]
MGLIDDVKNRKPSGSLKEVIKEGSKKDVQQKKEIPQKEEKKQKKINVSYTIDEGNNTFLMKHVMETNLENFGKEKFEKISASSIINDLLNKYREENS